MQETGFLEQSSVNVKKTVVIFGHASVDGSFANRIIANELSNVEGVSIRCLTEYAPGGVFDTASEQRCLKEADNIVFQFPIQWFNFPWIFKQWLKDVFTFESAENMLEGKPLLISITTGGKVEDDLENLTSLINNIKEFASYTGMIYSGEVVSGGFTFIPFLSGDKKQLRENALKHAESLKEKISML